MHKNKKAVSIIICAKNEQENLNQNLPYILNQQYPEFEVIVVDDGSDVPFSMQHKQLSILQLTKEEKIGLGKKYALKKGVEHAKYPWVLLTDADCKPETPDWITHIVAQANKQQKIVLGISPYRQAPTILNCLIEYETAQTALQYLGFALWNHPYMGVGRNILYQTELIKSKNWSVQELTIASGDDDLAIQELATGNNTTVCLSEASYTMSDAKNTWKEWFSQKTRHYQSGNLYRTPIRLFLGSYLIGKLCVYLLFLILVCTHQVANASVIFLGYVLSNTFLQFYFDKNTNLNNRWLYTFWNDFLYVFFTLSLGVLSIFKNKVRWK